MDAFKCDRCGKYFDGKGKSYNNRRIKLSKRDAYVSTNVTITYVTPDEPERNAELCPICMNDIICGAN